MYCVCVPLTFELGLFLGAMIVAVIALILNEIVRHMERRRNR